MVILEAMERGVPVLYPHKAGAAEVLASGIKINPEDIKGTAEELHRLLSDRSRWEKVVEDQNAEISSYYSRGYEQKLMQVFSEISAKTGQTGTGSGSRQEPVTT
jgi:glycosyltransferase involved in cell wall biosynthesis